jgi:hypothetical protein
MVVLIVFPYSLILYTAVLVAGISGRVSTISRFSSWLNLLILSYLMVDLPISYMMNTNQPLLNESSYLAHVLGLQSFKLKSLPLATLFLKLLIFLVQLSKLRYTHSMFAECSAVQEHLKSNIPDYESVQEPQTRSMLKKLARNFKTRESLVQKLVQPHLAHFLFASLGLFYALIHPNWPLLIILPVLISGFFTKWHRSFHIMILVLISSQVIMSQLMIVGMRTFKAIYFSKDL